MLNLILRHFINGNLLNKIKKTVLIKCISKVRFDFLVHETNCFELVEGISKWQVRDKRLAL